MTTPVIPQQPQQSAPQDDISPELRRNVRRMLDAGVPKPQIEAFVQKWSQKPDTTSVAPTPAAEAPERDFGLVDVGRSALSGLTLGTSAKPVAALRALMADNAGDKRSFSQRYEDKLAEERQSQDEFSRAHPIANAGIQLAGGLPLMLIPGLGGAGEVGTAARLYRAAKTGAALGAGAGFINADGSVGQKLKAGATEGVIGGVVGAAAEPVVGAVSKVAIKALDALTQRAAAAIGTKEFNVLATQRERLADALRAKGQKVATLNEALGVQGQAAEDVTGRLARDKAAGATPALAAPGVPRMVVDEAGEELGALAKNVAREPGGRARLSQALRTREEELGPNLQRELTTSTGEAAGQGTTPLRKALGEKRVAMDEAYSAARAETADQALDSPEFRQILKTPAGARAWENAKAQKLNRQRPLPTTEEVVWTRPDPPFEMNKDVWNKFLDDAIASGREVPGLSKEVITHEHPDAEALHMFKQELAKLAKLGVHDGQGGALASNANAIQGLFHKVRGQLPESWQAADEIAHEQAQRVEGLRAGLNRFRTKEIPPSPTIQTKTAKGQLGKSVDEIRSNVAAASPEVQENYRRGVANAAQQVLRETPGTARDVGQRLLKNQAQEDALREAFRNTADYDRFVNMARASSDVVKRNRELLTGSGTFGYASEAARRDAPSILGPITKLNFGDALKNAQKRLAPQAREKLNDEIAKILTSPNLSAAEKRVALRNATRAKLAAYGGIVGAKTVEGALPR